MFYCLFVLNYRIISLADYLSVVLFMFILLTTVKLSNKKKMAGATPLSPTYESRRIQSDCLNMLLWHVAPNRNHKTFQG